MVVAKGDGGTCDGSLVQALQKCANAIKGGESLSVQQKKCAPDGCNYDCLSASKYDEQIKNLTATLEKLQASHEAVKYNIVSMVEKTLRTS